MGGLMDSIRGEMETGGQPRKIKVLLASMDDRDRADLIAAMNDPTVTHAAIVKALNLRGIAVGHSTVGKWRREITR